MPRLWVPDKTIKRVKPPLGAEVDWGHPLARGLIGCYPINEGAGPQVIDLAYRNDAAFAGAGSKRAASVWGSCWEGTGGPNFSGTTDYILAPHSAKYDSLSGLTVAVLAKNHKSAIASTGSEYLSSMMGSGRDEWSFYWSQNEDVNFLVDNGTTTGTAVYTDGITDTKWHWHVGTYDGANVRVYVDGVVGGTSPALTGNIYNSTFPFAIGVGEYASNDASWDGLIAACYAFNRALSIAEIARLIAEPFCFLRVPKRRTIVFVAGGGAETKTVTDTGHGADAIAQIACSLSVSDTGHGTDAMGGLGAALGVQDTGHGTDAISQILAALGVSDSGHGTDALAAIAAVLSVADTGHGADSLAQLLASVTVTDTGHGADSLIAYILKTITDVGHGADAIGQIAASVSVGDTGHGADSIGSLTISLTVSDTGHGLDVVNVDTGATVIHVTDVGHGTDAIAAIAAALSVADTGHGTDAPNIAVSLTVSDLAHGADAVAQLIHGILVADTGHGADSVGQVTVSVRVEDTGHGTDQIAAILVLLAVADSAHGTDAVLKWDSTAQIASITFSMKKRSVTFSLKQPSISIGTFKKRDITFDLN